MPSLYRGFKQAIGFALGIGFALVILGNMSATRNVDTSIVAKSNLTSVHDKQLNVFMDSISRKVNDMEHKVETINEIRNMLEDLKQQNKRNQIQQNSFFRKILVNTSQKDRLGSN